MGRSDIPVPALGHLSLTASLQTIREETVPCGHTGTPLAFKHGARTLLSVHFSGLPLRENSCAQTLEEFMCVPLFKEMTQLPQCIWYYQHGVCFPQLTSAALPFGSCIWPPHVLSWVISDSPGPPASSLPSQVLQACSSPPSAPFLMVLARQA